MGYEKIQRRLKKRNLRAVPMRMRRCLQFSGGVARGLQCKLLAYHEGPHKF